MNEEKLFELIGNADDKFLEEIENKPGKRFRTPRWFDIAVCLFLILLVTLPVINLYRRNHYVAISMRYGRREKAEYDIYEGPVIPMTTLQNTKGIEASRDISIDFSNYDREGTWREGIILEDSYTLTNTTDQSKSFDILYPFVSNPDNVYDDMPTLLLDNHAITARLYTSMYISGTNEASTKGIAAGTAEALPDCKRFENALSDETSMNDVLTQDTRMSETNVIVYRLSVNDTTVENSSAASISDFEKMYIDFDMNHDITNYLSYGIGNDLSCTMADLSDSQAYLIIIGEDIKNLNFYDGNGNCLNALNIHIQREETSMEEILTEIAKTEYAKTDATSNKENSSSQDDELYLNDSLSEHHSIAFEDYCEFFKAYTSYMLKYYTVNQHDHDITFDYENRFYKDSVCYVIANITIPPMQSVTVTAASLKGVSYDRKVNSSQEGIGGYDFLTQSGSSLSFEHVTASLKNYDNVNIIKQNFGFDLKNKINTVTLDTATSGYYLVVRNKYYKTGKAKHKWYDWWAIGCGYY